MPIREDEWLAEVNRLSQRNVDGFSARELAELIGLSPRITREKIGAGIRLGVLEHVGFRTAISIDGKTFKTPIYRSKAKAKKRR